MLLFINIKFPYKYNPKYVFFYTAGHQTCYIQLIIYNNMSAGLIDWIFENLDVQKLDRKQVYDYLNYLKEIAGQETSLNKIIKYYSYKVTLEDHLVNLDQALVNTTSASTQEKDTDKSSPVV